MTKLNITGGKLIRNINVNKKWKESKKLCSENFRKMKLSILSLMTKIIKKLHLVSLTL